MQDRTVGRVAARGVGWMLGAVFAGWGVVRRDRPLHTEGQLWRGRMTVRRRRGRWPAVGSRLVDRPGRYRVLVRGSRAASWSLARDIPGLAIRVPGAPGGPVDLLLAGTGTSRWGRYVLRFRRGPHGPYTTLLPLVGRAGKVWFRADPTGEGRWQLSIAVQRGPWRRWARVSARGPALTTLRTDPVGRPPDGLSWPRWIQLVRDPAYRWSQRLTRTRRSR